MKYSKAKVELLEGTYALRILLTLKREGNISRAILYGMVSKSNRTVMNRLNHLIAAGLVQEFAQQTTPFSRYLTLTESGKRVADCVDSLEKALGN